MVTDISSMGFDKTQVEDALRAANYNQELAIDYVCNGIPSNPGLNFGGLGGYGGGLGGMGGEFGLEGEEGEEGEEFEEGDGPLGSIDPAQINQIREAIAQDPSVLNQLMANLQQTNPALANLIASNPMAFMAMLMQGGGAGGMGEEGPVGNQINLSPEEQKAVDRLMEYGFQEADVLEAYLACDKDENLALNYLFDKQSNGDLLTKFDAKPPGGTGGDKKN